MRLALFAWGFIIATDPCFFSVVVKKKKEMIKKDTDIAVKKEMENPQKKESSLFML